jgi:hypothetical protein
MAVTSTIQANILKELGLDSADTTLLARALIWANEALDTIQEYIPGAEFLQKSESYIACVADQATYALPSDFFQLLTLRDDDNSTSIEIITREEFDRRHTDPSSESTGKPYECCLEYDRTNTRHIVRVARIPDDTYTMYATMRNWHPALSASQNPYVDKLENAIKRGGMYYGSFFVYPDPEWNQLRADFERVFLNKVQSLSQILNIQKPHPPQIPVVMKKTNY